MNIKLKKRQRCQVCKYWELVIDGEKRNFEYSAGVCHKAGKKFDGSNSILINAPVRDGLPCNLLTGEDFCCCLFANKENNCETEES